MLKNRITILYFTSIHMVFSDQMLFAWSIILHGVRGKGHFYMEMFDLSKVFIVLSEWKREAEVANTYTKNGFQKSKKLVFTMF